MNCAFINIVFSDLTNSNQNNIWIYNKCGILLYTNSFSGSETISAVLPLLDVYIVKASSKNKDSKVVEFQTQPIFNYGCCRCLCTSFCFNVEGPRVCRQIFTLRDRTYNLPVSGELILNN